MRYPKPLKKAGVSRYLLRVLAAVCVSGFWVGSSCADIVTTDDAGRSVQLAKPAQRIVALSPHIVENLFAIGAGDLVVGAVEHSDYPEPAKLIPRVGQFASINIESIVKLKPDLVITWGSGNGEAIIEKLAALRIPVYMDEPRKLLDIAHSLQQLGRLTNRSASANKAADDFSQQMLSLKFQYSERQPVTVLYQIWHQPMQTVNGTHLISALIDLCGGQNIFADALPLAPTVSMESVLARNPQVIIASGVDDQPPPWLKEWQEWPALSAVRNQQLHTIPPDYLQRHTPRILLGAQLLCDQLDAARQQR